MAVVTYAGLRGTVESIIQKFPNDEKYLADVLPLYGFPDPEQAPQSLKDLLIATHQEATKRMKQAMMAEFDRIAARPLKLEEGETFDGVCEKLLVPLLIKKGAEASDEVTSDLQEKFKALKGRCSNSSCKPEPQYLDNCQKCFKAAYCSPKCRDDHWRIHKYICQLDLPVGEAKE